MRGSTNVPGVPAYLFAKHTNNRANPHGVDKAQVGLDQVDNTSDQDKPVSIKQATAIADAKKAGTDAQEALEKHIKEADVSLSNHNTDTSAHNDIRLLISGLTDRLNALFDTDDTTLDSLSEIVAYIESNKELIESVTISKVNVADIVNNLTTNDPSVPLSAAMGVELKKLIDTLKNEVETAAAADAEVIGRLYSKNFNLLDNSDFTNPVNQRGATYYAKSSHAIDRWRTGASVELYVKDGFVQVHSDGTFLNQYLSPDMLTAGKKYTIAVKQLGGPVYVTTATVNAVIDFGDEPIEGGYAEFPDFGYLALGADMVNTDVTEYRFFIGVKAGLSVDLEWAALYEGEYTAETLPAYVPKGYAAELMECLRYYTRMGSEGALNVAFAYANSETEASAIVYLPVPMRETPTVSIVSGTPQLVHGENTFNIDAVSISNVCNNICNVDLISSGLEVGSIYVLRLQDAVLELCTGIL